MKTFENFENNYFTGDYVLLKDIFINKQIQLSGEIKEVRDNKFHIIRYDAMNRKTYAWYGFNDIQRKLTEDEIDKFKMIDTSKKYNL